MSKALVISTAICASLFTLNAHAQTRKVQGTVVGTDQKALVGVSVTVSGTKIVAVTDQRGKFSIEIPGNNNELQFTYVGFQTKKVTIPMSDFRLKKLQFLRIRRCLVLF